jgi:2-isopropylmalate synthase
MRDIIAATGHDIGITGTATGQSLSIANVAAIARARAVGRGCGSTSGRATLHGADLVSLYLLGWSRRPLGSSPRTAIVSSACGIRPAQLSVVGADAFETATGVHAAAVIKAFKKGDRALADRVYSSVPAGELGLEQKIRVGPMSGRSNVVFWLEKRGIEATDVRVDTIFKAAKSSPRLLEDAEMLALIQGS